ncbi:hypothetical protein BKA81DRAFT_368598 [Phyllosticta paracitricarpa]
MTTATAFLQFQCRCLKWPWTTKHLAVPTCRMYQQTPTSLTHTGNPSIQPSTHPTDSVHRQPVTPPRSERQDGTQQPQQ